MGQMHVSCEVALFWNERRQKDNWQDSSLCHTSTTMMRSYHYCAFIFWKKKLKMCNFCITIHMNIVCISKKYNECQICTAYGNHAWKDMSFGKNENLFWTKLKKLFTKSQTLTVLFFKFKQTPKVAIETDFNSRVAHISCHFVYKSKKSHKMKGFFKITAIFHLSLTPQITYCWDLWFNPQRFVIWFRLFVITFFPLQCQTLYEIQLCCLLCFIVLHIL